MVERLIISGDNAAKHVQAYIDYHKYRNYLYIRSQIVALLEIMMVAN